MILCLVPLRVSLKCLISRAYEGITHSYLRYTLCEVRLGRPGPSRQEVDAVAVSAARQAVIDGVKAHALEHYSDGGWDVVVEAWSDDQILDAASGSRTVSGAVKMLSAVVD